MKFSSPIQTIYYRNPHCLEISKLISEFKSVNRNPRYCRKITLKVEHWIFYTKNYFSNFLLRIVQLSLQNDGKWISAIKRNAFQHTPVLAKILNISSSRNRLELYNGLKESSSSYGRDCWKKQFGKKSVNEDVVDKFSTFVLISTRIN